VDFDAKASEVETALEAHANITDVEVRGGGQSHSPWVISFVNPKTSLATFTVDDTNGGAGGIDDSTTLTESEATARVIDYDPENEIIALRILKGRHQLADDDDNIRGLTSGASVSIDASGVTDTIAPTGGPAGFITPNCTDDDELCILIEGDYEDPPIIDCGIFRTAGSATGAPFASGGTGSGWLGVQNFIVQDCAGDVMSCSNSSNAAYLNVEARKVRNILGTAENNNGITSHNTCSLVTINAVVSGMQDSESGNGAPVAPGSDSDDGAPTTVIGQGVLECDASESTAGAAADLCTTVVARTGKLSLVGHTVTGVQSAASSVMEPLDFSGSTFDVAVNLCRVTADSQGTNGAAMRIGINHATKGLTLRAWETTMSGVNGIQLSNMQGGQDTFTGRGMVFHDLSGFIIRDNGDNDEFIAMDLEGIHEDQAVWGWFDGANKTLAQSRTIAEASNSGTSLFNSNSEQPANAPWDNSGGTVTLPGYVTHPDCGGGTCAAIGQYTCPLVQPIPAFASPTGSTIPSLTLDGKIGGR
jgi:hypothetical protein